MLHEIRSQLQHLYRYCRNIVLFYLTFRQFCCSRVGDVGKIRSSFWLSQMRPFTSFFYFFSAIEVKLPPVWGLLGRVYCCGLTCVLGF